MENGEQPAYPVTVEQKNAFGYQPVTFEGLTKREAFAMAAMQGLLARSSGGLSNEAIAIFARESVQASDTLLKQLSTP